MPSAVKLDHVSKNFGEVKAIDDMVLDVAGGEFMSILGPSGCGKTTSLRLIAGFTAPDRGDVLINDKIVTGVPPYKRNVGMVFQNYALFPHLTVSENIAFGLKVRNLPRLEVESRVKKTLELVRLQGEANRYVGQLSGGQQQRVALGRAIVVEPHVLLLDEPLSNLDPKLRESMRMEIRAILKQVQITSILVTHDQVEALTISDRVAVMNQGRILQVGSPAEVYRNPGSKFVAQFIGDVNIFEGRVEKVEGNAMMVATKEGLVVRIPIRSNDRRLKEGSSVLFFFRPEAAAIVADRGVVHEDTVSGIVENIIHTGPLVHFIVSLPGGSTLKVVEKEGSAHGVKIGSKVSVQVDPSSIGLLESHYD